ncbi:MAG: hypothetical protein M3O15_11430, partial [Acidobacteriota bacterium]|nr:hypothetical protein [Acidobacteriota bacterium]
MTDSGEGSTPSPAVDPVLAQPADAEAGLAPHTRAAATSDEAATADEATREGEAARPDFTAPALPANPGNPANITNSTPSAALVPSAAPRPGGLWASHPAALAAILCLILAASVVPRLPWLANPAVTFNSDEAVDALVIGHLLHGRELTLFNWDAHYYGIVEGLLGIPFLALGAGAPLAFKLGSLAGFLGLPLAAFLLGRRLHGPGAGLVAAALTAVFSPQLVQWSVLASGGFTLVVTWGSFTLLQLDRLRRRPGAGNLVLLGFMVGFGLYIYELFLVYVAVLACAWLSSSVLWRALLARRRSDLLAQLRAAPRELSSTLLFLTGFAAGWSPKLAILLTHTPIGSKRPAYRLASAEQALANLRLLAGKCAPALLGINPTGDPELGHFVGSSFRLAALLGALLAAAYALAWLAGAARVRSEVAGTLRYPPVELGTEALLVLLPLVTAVLFLLSPNPQGVLSNRYLLPA